MDKDMFYDGFVGKDVTIKNPTDGRDDQWDDPQGARSILPIVCIDPGHGGKEPGAVSAYGGYKEKDVALEISGLVASYLLYASRCREKGAERYTLSPVCPIKPNPVVDVVMTRVKDVHISLESRCRMANLSRASCFVSIHCNSHKNVTASGIETWGYSRSDKSLELASRVQERMMGLVRGFRVMKYSGDSHPPKDRGVKRSDSFYTLKHTRMPSIVVECGFMSNRGEVDLLVTDFYQHALASGIAAGVLDFLKP